MIKGYWERRVDKNCESIYLIDNEKDICYTFELTAHVMKNGELNKSTDIDRNDGLGILKALAEALQEGGYIPRSATDAELKATKCHLEDMRKLTLEGK